MARRPLTPDEERKQLKEELAQREAELSIISSVQEGLASHLDVQAIYDLVGSDSGFLRCPGDDLHDPVTNTVEHRYAYEKGGANFPASPLRVVFGRKSFAPASRWLVNTHVAEKAARLGQPTIPGTITLKNPGAGCAHVCGRAGDRNFEPSKCG